MSNIVNLSHFVAKKEQEKKDAENREWDALYQFISEVIENNPESSAPFFAYSESDMEASTIDIAIMKLMDAITLLDNLGKKKKWVAVVNLNSN